VLAGALLSACGGPGGLAARSLAAGYAVVVRAGGRTAGSFDVAALRGLPQVDVATPRSQGKQVQHGPRVRTVLYGRLTAGELLTRVPIDDVRDLSGARPGPEDAIELGRWVRPILAGGRAVLLVEAAGGPAAWRVAPREVVKRH
jgi:hypothetical protein